MKKLCPTYMRPSPQHYKAMGKRKFRPARSHMRRVGNSGSVGSAYSSDFTFSAIAVGVMPNSA